ncbi:MAG: hypothetical protein EP315_01140 [Gammaproteobacteria bacterium]|nr:MAG: hypothetical protein EP315_01140 [Gammaproteobacteria bacterium]
MLRVFKQLFALVILLAVVTSLQAEDISREQIKGLDEQVQDIKKDVIDLTADLMRLEEKLLFPSNTQVSIFISLAEGDDFRLDAVQVKLDNKVVSHHLYTFRELEALQKGGVQRIYTGNVHTGEHDLVVSFIGKAPAGGELQRSASYKLNKNVGPKFVEVKLSGSNTGGQDISFKDW